MLSSVAMMKSVVSTALLVTVVGVLAPWSVYRWVTGVGHDGRQIINDGYKNGLKKKN